MTEIAHKKSSPVEQKRRLSRSILWKLQRNYFDAQGIRAWSTGAVPHHITSNPYIADAYARVVFGFLRDCAAVSEETAAPSFPPLDRGRPVHVVELGSGPGRFAYLFLKRFLAVQRRSALRGVPVRYVMTDFAERNLDYWRAHPRLRPFVEDGSLDFALFDAERPAELGLINSGDTLSPETLRNPLVVISNYLFDSIRQDAFFVSGGQLFETLVTLSTPRKEDDPDDPEILSRMEVSYDNVPVEGDYYDDPAWNRLLEDYRRRLPGVAFLFPVAALGCVEYLRLLSGGRMLLLSGDRGYHGDESLLGGAGAPALAVHGSFSMMVDYQLIGEFCALRGGHALHPARRQDAVNISAMLFGDVAGGFAETRLAYAEAVEKFGPDDFHRLKGGVEQTYGAFSLEQLLAFLRLSGWDYKRFWECLPALKGLLPGLGETQKRELYDAARQVWDAYLPIGEEDDLAFQIATLLLEMEFYAEALEFLRHSESLYGLEPGTAYNMAVSHHGLRRFEEALGWADRALELDPEFDAAKALRIQLLSTVGRPTHSS